MLPDDYYDMCYGCFSQDDLVPCGRCVYKICKRCILSEKFSKVKVPLCRHDECVYDHLDKEDATNLNCFVCNKTPPSLVYKCGTCGLDSTILVDDVLPAILAAVIRSPCRTWEKEITNINHKLMFFSIRNIDDDTHELIKVWKS